MVVWNYEGIEFYVPFHPNENYRPVYRVWNGEDHLYTTSNSELLPGGCWREGTAFYVGISQLPGHVPLYRLYDEEGGDHFYCISSSEKEQAIELLGFRDEGILGYVLPGHLPFAPDGFRPVFRSFHAVICDHFYTANCRECIKAVSPDELLGDRTWKYESDVGFISTKKEDDDFIPVYRAWNGNDHFYTNSYREYSGLPNKYYREGIAFYLSKSERSGQTISKGKREFFKYIPLFRLYNGSWDDHFYCTSVNERDNAIQNIGFVDEGILGYVRTSLPNPSSGFRPLYRFFNGKIADHFYTMECREILVIRSKLVVELYASQEKPEKPSIMLTGTYFRFKNCNEWTVDIYVRKPIPFTDTGEYGEEEHYGVILPNLTGAVFVPGGKKWIIRMTIDFFGESTIYGPCEKIGCESRLEWPDEVEPLGYCSSQNGLLYSPPLKESLRRFDEKEQKFIIPPEILPKLIEMDENQRLRIYSRINDQNVYLKRIKKYIDYRRSIQEQEKEFKIVNCAEGLGLFDQECKGYPVIDKQVLYEGKQSCKAIDMCGIQAHAGYYMIGSGGKEFEFDIDEYPILYLTMKAEKDTDTCLLLVVHDKKPRDFMRRFIVVGKTREGNRSCVSVGVVGKDDFFTIKDDNKWQDYTYDLRKLRSDYPDAKTVRMVQFYSGKLCNGIPHTFHFSSLVFKK